MGEKILPKKRLKEGPVSARSIIFHLRRLHLGLGNFGFMCLYKKMRVFFQSNLLGQSFCILSRLFGCMYILIYPSNFIYQAN